MGNLRLSNGGASIKVDDDIPSIFLLNNSFNSINNKLTKKEKEVRSKQNNRESKLRTKYGIDQNVYNQMLKSQNYSCKICGTLKADNTKNGHKKHFNVDHCHSTGKIRGLLCTLCNTRIGFIESSLPLLKNIFDYLELNIEIK